MNLKDIKKTAVQKLMLLFFILCITFVSVSLAKATSFEDIFGAVNGDKYENTLIGYGCDLPGWYYYTEDDIAALYQLSKEAYPQEIVDMLESSSNITVMFAEDSQGKNNINIQLQYAKQNIPIYTLMGMDWLIDNMMNSLVEMYSSAGYMVTDSEKVRIAVGEEQHVGIKTSVIKDDEKMFFEEISFIRGDYMVFITATSVGEDTTRNSLSHFYSLNSSPEIEEAKSDNTYYVDADSNILFLIPSGWNEGSLSEESEAIQAQLKAKFVNNRNGIATIIYMSYDIANLASDNEDEIAWARKVFSTEMLSEDLIASMAGTAGTVPEDIQLKQYGENTYYVYDTESALDTKTRVAIMVKNGYEIMFMLNAFSLDGYITEFDSILASVAFQ